MSKTAATHVVLYSRPGCHLCEIVEQLLHHVQKRRPFELIICDIDQDPAAYERYKHDIPVVMVNGREVARHTLTAAGLEEAIGGGGG